MLRLLACLASAVVALVAACTPSPRHLSSAEGSAAGAPLVLRSYADWWHRIGAIMEHELGFPRLEAALLFFPHQQALERALVEDGMPPVLAKQAARTLDAVGRAGKVMVNEARLVRLPWPERVRVLAHERTHAAQYQLSGGRRGSSEQWLREGWAEWVAWQVTEILQLGSIAAHRREAEARVQSASQAGVLPSLTELCSSADLLAKLARHPQPPLYDQAFLAVDALVAAHGVARLLEYFRLCAESNDAAANFQRAFGQTREAFSQEFARHFAAR